MLNPNEALKARVPYVAMDRRGIEKEGGDDSTQQIHLASHEH